MRGGGAALRPCQVPPAAALAAVKLVQGVGLAAVHAEAQVLGLALVLKKRVAFGVDAEDAVLFVPGLEVAAGDRVLAAGGLALPVCRALVARAATEAADAGGGVGGGWVGVGGVGVGHWWGPWSASSSFCTPAMQRPCRSAAPRRRLRPRPCWPPARRPWPTCRSRRGRPISTPWTRRLQRTWEWIDGGCRDDYAFVHGALAAFRSMGASTRGELASGGEGGVHVMGGLGLGVGRRAGREPALLATDFLPVASMDAEPAAGGGGGRCWRDFVRSAHGGSQSCQVPSGKNRKTIQGEAHQGPGGRCCPR